MYSITVNGQQIQTNHSAIKPVLDELGLTLGRFAVEIDGNLVPKSELATTKIIEGMVIEVVQAVGGG